MERYIGKMLDNRYEILEIIGTGGMAVVFKARCHRLNRLVAIKMLKKDLSEDADFRRRFHDESQAVAMLSHPNIVAVYDVSRGSDMDYIVMELIDGITLKQYMERRGKLDWPEALHFITQIMKGLSHAHSRGIVHRDIKPQNIMILRDGTVKVTDFGIACLSNGSHPSNEAIGSVHYISPEQAKGDYTDNRSDIYSAGVVLYEMLTSRLPFEGTDPMEIALQHLNSVPADPRDLNPDIPEALEQICKKAMATDRNRRYSTADEMLADLEAFRRDPSVHFDYAVGDICIDAEENNEEPTRYLPNTAATRRNARRESAVRDVEEDGEEEEDRPRGRWWVTLLLIIIILLAGYFGVTTIYRSVMARFTPMSVPEHTVPNVVGKTIAEAEAMPELQSALFELAEDAEEYSGEYAAGQIIRQDPEANGKKKSSTGDPIPISVVVSLGLREDSMPDLIGMEGRAAMLRLTQGDGLSELHLTVVEGDSIYDDTVEAGCVARTEPAEGETLREGDTVTLCLSMGPETRYSSPMITCLGRTVDWTRERVTALGLSPEFRAVEGSAPEGTILSQDLAEGDSLPVGSTVCFTYSNGLQLLTQTIDFDVPDSMEPVHVEMYLGDSLVYEDRVDGNYSAINGPLQVTLSAVAGEYPLQIYCDEALYEVRMVTFYA